MKIQRTDSNLIAFQKGFYYFNNAKKAYELQEKSNIAKEIKNRFENSKLLQEMSKKYKTYISYNDSNLNTRGKKHSVTARIWWANEQQKPNQVMLIKGESYSSKDNAINNMFNSLV